MQVFRIDFSAFFASQSPGKLPCLALWPVLLLAFLPLPLSATTDEESGVDSDMTFHSEGSLSASRRTDAGSTADHSKFEQLQGPFTSGPDVTRACLECHTEADDQFMESIHWTWEYRHPETDQLLGKRHLVNNFCTNARGNEGMCAQCHTGYNWENNQFDFTRAENIDCLICHDRTGSYYRPPPTKGNEACSIMFEGKEPFDWARVAQDVGQPGRENCGVCHFFGGGGDGVKHGDLDSSLGAPPRALDVHMDAEGLNFPCTQCHVTEKHLWAGSRYNVVARDTGGTGKPGMRRDVATCESCHGTAPHANTEAAGLKLNDHVDRVACQTCHIPAMARGGVATMTFWDWRTAGRTRDGVAYKEKNYTQGNGEHRATYKTIKGSFEYDENIVPRYAWFDGRMIYTTIDTRFDPDDAPIPINRFEGAANDPGARIWPFKRMHSVQPYDKGKNTLVYMHLWGDDPDAFWGNYDFGRAIARGMEKNDIPYSGEHGFIETYSYWPTTHMVAPKEEALACAACHSDNGRLADLGGFYLPGRDGRWTDWIGLLLVGGSLAAVLLHTLLRLISAARRRAT